jgi:hypothetical protein
MRQTHAGAAIEQVVIENSIPNSPYEEPRRHFKLTEAGFPAGIIEARRNSQ